MSSSFNPQLQSAHALLFFVVGQESGVDGAALSSFVSNSEGSIGGADEKFQRGFFDLFLLRLRDKESAGVCDGFVVLVESCDEVGEVYPVRISWEGSVGGVRL